MTATIQSRAGTRMPSKPGSIARIAYGPGRPIAVPAIFGAGPSDSTHISPAAATKKTSGAPLPVAGT